MTQENKELLLKDLCSRLPYGVEVEYDKCACEVLSIDKDNEVLTIWKNYGYKPDIKLEEVRPYLFPMSSMTVKQRDSYRFLTSSAHASPVGLIDFFHKNHIDYRGLIPKGLAKDATNLNIY